MSANLSRPATSNGPAAGGSTAHSPSSVTPVHPAISPRSRHPTHPHSHSHSYSTPSTTGPGQPPYPHSPYIGTGSTLSSTALAGNVLHTQCFRSETVLVEHTPGPGQCFCSTCHLKTRVFPRRQDGKIVLPSPWLVSQMARPGRQEDVDRQRLEQQQQGTTHAYRRRAMTAVSMGASVSTLNVSIASSIPSILCRFGYQEALPVPNIPLPTVLATFMEMRVVEFKNRKVRKTLSSPQLFKYSLLLSRATRQLPQWQMKGVDREGTSSLVYVLQKTRGREQSLPRQVRESGHASGLRHLGLQTFKRHCEP